MSQRKVDPISLLRDAFTSNSKIVLVDFTLVFDSQIKLSLDTPTAWQPPDNNKRYTIGDLWLFMDSKRNATTNYYERINEFKGKLQMISMQHQSNLTRRDRRLFYWKERNLRLYQRNFT